jgi:hypothetical protein
VDFFGKSRLACFYTCGSSVTLRLGFLTESKSGDNKIATDLPFLSAPVVELADTMDFGDVTLVKGFCYVLTRDLCTVVDKHLEGDAYGASGIKRKLLSLRGNDFQNSI